MLIASRQNFGQAIEALKLGYLVERCGWNGKWMWLALTEGSTIAREHARSGAVKALANSTNEATVTINAHIDMRTADCSICCGWLASQADMLAEDWIIFDQKPSPYFRDLTYDEAMDYTKDKGFKLRRMAWNHTKRPEVWLYLEPDADPDDSRSYKLTTKPDELPSYWEPSTEDLAATDWYLQGE